MGADPDKFKQAIREQREGGGMGLARKEGQARVRADGLGQWIDMGGWALRPAEPSSLREGDMAKVAWGGASGRQGVALVEGRGAGGLEGWIRGPQGPWGGEPPPGDKHWERHLVRLGAYWMAKAQGGSIESLGAFEMLMEEELHACREFGQAGLARLSKEGKARAAAARAAAEAMAISDAAPPAERGPRRRKASL